MGQLTTMVQQLADMVMRQTAGEPPRQVPVPREAYQIPVEPPTPTGEPEQIPLTPPPERVVPGQSLQSPPGLGPDPLQQSDPWRNFVPPNPEGSPFVGQSRPLLPELQRVVPPMGGQPSSSSDPRGSAQLGGHDDSPFKRSEKWMPAVPTPDHKAWNTRPQEVEGFLSWIYALSTWTGYGSNEFPKEILFSIKHPSRLDWSIYNAAMITRSIRLLSIVESAFQDRPRAWLIIQNYKESMGRVNCCGFEALRLLAKEFGIKTRAEMLFFRQRATQGTLQGSSIPDTVRLIESEMFKYERRKETVDPTVNISDLSINEADKVLLLLRSLPHACRIPYLTCC